MISVASGLPYPACPPNSSRLKRCCSSMTSCVSARLRALTAALLGSRELAVKALSLHPLVPSVNTARAIFDGYRERLPALQEAFA